MIAAAPATAAGVENCVWSVAEWVRPVRSMSRQDAFKDAIELEHHCRAEHVRSAHVVEKFGDTVWRGVVEVFELVGHPEAKCCYARSEEHTSELQSRQYLVCRLMLDKKNHRSKLT